MFDYRLHDIRPQFKIQDYFKKDEWALFKLYKTRKVVVRQLTNREKDRLKIMGVANTCRLWNRNYGRQDRTNIDFEYDTYNKYKGGRGGSGRSNLIHY